MNTPITESNALKLQMSSKYGKLNRFVTTSEFDPADIDQFMKTGGEITVSIFDTVTQKITTITQWYSPNAAKEFLS